jgi:ATP-dependent RNA helicase SUPV3L1/SUV3
LHGLARIGELAVPAQALERLGEALRAAPRRDGGAILTAEALAGVGPSPEGAELLLRALGFAPAGRAQAGQPLAWRRRGAPRTAKPVHSPFAVLGRLAPTPAKRRTRIRRA